MHLAEPPPGLVAVQLGRERAKRCPYCQALYGLTGVQNVGGIEVDPAARSVRYRGRPVHLSVTLFDLLLMLMSRPESSYDAIISALGLEDADDPEKLVAVHVWRLRRALGDNAAIENVWGHGYRIGPGNADLPCFAQRRHVALWRELASAPGHPQHWKDLSNRAGIKTYSTFTNAINQLRPMIPRGEIRTYRRRGMYVWFPGPEARV